MPSLKLKSSLSRQRTTTNVCGLDRESGESPNTTPNNTPFPQNKFQIYKSLFRHSMHSFDHRREWARTDYENNGLPRKEWEDLLRQVLMGLPWITVG